jgi:hypothetical protein
MDKKSLLIILVNSFTIYWWLCMAYSRHKTAKQKAVEKARYGRWDEAYAKALKEDKGVEYAVKMATQAVNANPSIVMSAWKDSYNKSIANGVRNYTAGTKAAAVAREIAHRR